MASANHHHHHQQQQLAEQNATATSQFTGIHQQQQEIIKILTQHFHQQFYQMAHRSSPQGVESQLNQLLNVNSFQDSNQSTVFANELSLSKPNDNSNGAFDLTSSINLASQNVASNFNQHQQSASNRSSGNNPNSSSRLESQNSAQSSHQLVSNEQANYVPNSNDLSLLQAFGLNLTNLASTNPHLLLSFQAEHQRHRQQQQQQQSLIGQAALTPAASGSNRQRYGPSQTRQRDSNTDLEAVQQRNMWLNALAPAQLPLQSFGKLLGERAVAAATAAARGHDSTTTSAANVGSRKGAGLLKFSINTILGCGSPGPECVPGDDVIPSKLGAKSQSQLDLLGENEFEHDDNSCSSSLTSTSASPLPATQAANNSNAGDNSSKQQLASSSTSRSQRNQLALQAHQLAPNATSASFPSFISNSHSPFPWAVAARGKPRRGMMRRAVFSDNQRVGLERRFQLQKYISKPDRKKLAEKLGLKDSQVKIWFQNRRMKWRNSKERELLSTGGSREQTLPTRNNPNPDLSDVGQSKKGPESVSSLADMLQDVDGMPTQLSGFEADMTSPKSEDSS